MLLVTSAAPSRFPCPSSPGQQCLRAVNITGVVFITVALAAKLLGMLHQLVPDTSVIAVLRDPNSPEFEAESRDLEETGHAIGRQILMVNVANEREFHGAFAKIA